MIIHSQVFYSSVVNWILKHLQGPWNWGFCAMGDWILPRVGFWLESSHGGLLPSPRLGHPDVKYPALKCTSFAAWATTLELWCSWHGVVEANDTTQHHAVPRMAPLREELGPRVDYRPKSIQLLRRKRLGAMTHPCNSSILGGQGGWIIRSGIPDQPKLVKPISTKNTKISWAWWWVVVIPATWEAEAEESLEPERWRLQ